MRISSDRCACLVIAAAALVLFGCSGTRPAVERELPDAFPHHSADQILFFLNAHGDTLDAYRARASVAVKSPENSGQFSAEMQARRDDSLYVSISPGLGIEAARALVTPDSFYFYDRLKNRVIYGSLDEAAGVLPEPFGAKDLFDNLLGVVVPPSDVAWDVSSDESYYYLRDPEGQTLFVIDPAFWRVARLDRLDASGTLLERRIFSEFDELDGAVLPRRLVFQRPLEDRMASIYYRSLRLNPDELEFDLDVRSSAERVPAGD